MKEKIKALLHNILSSDWNVRTTALSELMSMNNPESVIQIWENLDKTSDILCIYFCQFLQSSLFTNGVPYLIEFLSDPRERVQQEAIWTLDNFLENNQIPDAQKVSLLIKIMNTDGERGKIYAAEAFRKYHKREGVSYLIEKLSDSSGRVRLACANALREIGDNIAIPYLASHLQDASSDVRYAICFALGEMEASLYWKKIVPLLKDNSIVVRQAATWAIGRLSGKKAIPYLTEILEHDPAPLVQIEAAKRLGKIHHPTVTEPLLKAFAKSKYPNVKNTAHYALDGLSDKIKLNVYIQNTKSSDIAVRMAALTKMATIKTDRAYPIILKTYEGSANNPQLQATCCECFGTIGDKRSIPLLETALRGNPIVAYSAIRAIATLIGDEEKKYIISLLNDETLGEMSHQIILQFILKKIKDEKMFLDADLSNILIQKLSAPQLNIAYLAVQILEAGKVFSAIIPILKAAQNTKYPELKRKLFYAIAYILDGNAVILIKLMKQKFFDLSLTETLLQCLQLFECPKVHKLPSLLALCDAFLSGPKEYHLQLLALLSHFAGDNTDSLLQLLYQTTWSDFLTFELLGILDQKIEVGNPKNILLKIAPLQRSLSHRDKNIRILSARLLEKIGQDSSVPILTSLYLKEPEVSVRGYLKAALRSITQGVKS